jgi:Ca-activated chloride channel family protein
MMRPLYSLMLLAAACGPPKKIEVPPPPPPVIAASDPQLVTLEAAFGNKYAMADQDADVVARLRIDTRDLPAKERPPLRLTLVMDTSGSMEGKAIDAAREAALAILDELDAGDFFSLVVFHSRTEVLVPTMLIGKDKADLEGVRARIRDIQATGTTDMQGGLTAAIGQAATGIDTQKINRIVLLSDGIPNDPAQILALAQQSQSYGVPITALGIGLEYDETLLGAIARTSGGTFHQIKSNEDVMTAFKSEVLRMKRLVARQMVLQIVPGPGVAIQGVIGLQAQPSGRGVYVTLGDLSQGERRDVLVKMKVKGHRPEARIEIADAVLTFQDAVQNAGSLSRNLFLSILSTSDKALFEGNKDKDIEKAAARAELSHAVVTAIAYARSGQVDAAEKLLDDAETRARLVVGNGADPVFRQQLAELRPLRKALPTLAPPPPPPPSVVAGKPQPRPPAPMVEATEDDKAAVRNAHDTATKPSQPEPRNQH